MADTYLEIGFSENTILEAFENSGEIKTKIENSMPDEFNELNDYSYTGSQNYEQTDKITVYWDGKLIWGEEPGEAVNQEDLGNTGDESYLLAVYPNPAASHTSITWKNKITSATGLKLIDYNRNVYRVSPKSLNGTEVRLSLPKVRVGVYILTGKINGKEFSHRILIR